MSWPSRDSDILVSFARVEWTIRTRVDLVFGAGLLGAAAVAAAVAEWRARKKLGILMR